MKKLIISLLLIISINAYSQESNFPKEINLVFDFLLKIDYPELFGGNPYQFRPVSWQIIDIDDDGLTEVFLRTFPHFRQSPTITIFQIHPNDSVIRIIEGFAPGHLTSLSKKDDYLDPHSTGTAIDAQLDSKDPNKYKIFAESSLKFGMSVVLYKNFIHMDKREGKGVFIDLMYLDDYNSENSCANFQFSTPEQIIAGKLKDKPHKYFIAKVDKELFCYQIHGIIDNKFIDKEIQIIPLPKEFKKFQLVDGLIKYENTKGQIIDL